MCYNVCNMVKFLERSIPILIVCLVALCFHAAGGFGLAACDDYFYICYDSHVTRGLTLGGVKWALTNVDWAIWMPLTWISYMFDYSAGWGLSGMHWHSIAWYAASAVVLFKLLRELSVGRDTAIPLLAALVWALHPLRVESVVWLASRKDVVSSFFFLSALYAWVKAKDTESTLKAIGLFLLGAMAKPSVMVFPLFIPVIDFCILNRRKNPMWYALLAAIGFVIAVEASLAQNVGGAMTASQGIPLYYRLINAVASLSVYLGNFIWPHNLSIMCMTHYPALPKYSIPGLGILLAAVAVISHGVYIALSAKRYNATPSLILLYFAAFVPFLGIVGVGLNAFADRFTILPSIALSLLIIRLPFKRISATCLVLFILACGALTIRQTSYWQNDEVLFKHTLEVDGENNVYAWGALGNYHWEFSHDCEKTYQCYKRAFASMTDEQKEGLGSVALQMVECAYETGRKAEADDWYCWMRKWDYRQSPNERTLVFQIAEALDALYNNRRKEAEDTCKDLLSRFPNDSNVLNLSYRLAATSGDATRRDKAKHRAYADSDKRLYMQNRWAK